MLEVLQVLHIAIQEGEEVEEVQVVLQKFLTSQLHQDRFTQLLLVQKEMVETQVTSEVTQVTLAESLTQAALQQSFFLEQL